MPLGLFINPNFTVEEAMEIHTRERNKWKSKMDDEDREHEARLAEAKEVNAAKIFIAVVQDLERGDGLNLCEKMARQFAHDEIHSLHELHATLQTVNIMFMMI